MKLALFLITLCLSLSVLAAPHEESQGEQNADLQTCTFESPDVGKIKFRGATREQAFEQTSRVCLQTRVETFIRKKGTTPTTERKILFAEDCVNKTYCKH
jgi:hypothetical protein